MRRFRLINKNGYFSPEYVANNIYDGEYKVHPELCNVQNLRDYNPNDWVEVFEYIKCVNNGKSFSTHPNALEFGCKNYDRGVDLTEGLIYKVIKYVEINKDRWGYSCEYNGKHYLIGESGIEGSTKEAYDLQFIEPYENVMNIEVGDIVKCTVSPKSKYGLLGGGCGYKSGLVFTVTDVKDYKTYKIYFGGEKTNGVYSDCVRLVEKAFVLPEKWCIKGSVELKNWQLNEMDDKCNAHLNEFNYYYYLMDGIINKWSFTFEKPSDYTLITFEQFYKYIYLKTNIKDKIMEKKLIGYKLKDDCKCYEAAAAKIAFTIPTDTLSALYNGINFTHDSNVSKALEKAGVLDLWFEEVYKDDKVIPVINNYRGEKLDDLTVKYGCAEFNVATLAKIVSCEKLSDNRSIESINLSSGVTINMKQIKQIVEYFR